MNRRSKNARRWSTGLVSALALGVAAGAAAAEPLAVMDRNGSYVSVETYAPNIVRVTISQDRDLAAGAPGYGFTADSDAKGWRHDQKGGADIFTSGALSLEVV